MNIDNTFILPSIAERCNRPCDTCIWNNTDENYCFMIYDLNNEIELERTGNYKKVVWSQLQSIPCRFHLTLNELNQILDPYFMG